MSEQKNVYQLERHGSKFHMLKNGVPLMSESELKDVVSALNNAEKVKDRPSESEFLKLKYNIEKCAIDLIAARESFYAVLDTDEDKLPIISLSEEAVSKADTAITELTWVSMKLKHATLEEWRDYHTRLYTGHRQELKDREAKVSALVEAAKAFIAKRDWVENWPEIDNLESALKGLEDKKA